MSLEERRMRANVHELQNMAEARANDLYFLKKEIDLLRKEIVAIQRRLDAVEETEK